MMTLKRPHKSRMEVRVQDMTAVLVYDGTQRNLWVDAKSFLELKIDGDPRRMDGKLRKVAMARAPAQ